MDQPVGFDIIVKGASIPINKKRTDVLYQIESGKMGMAIILFHGLMYDDELLTEEEEAPPKWSFQYLAPPPIDFRQM
jgi:hypothetical protein